ncbi:MAG: alpha/beta hydrolase [Pseudomonadota bacterium]
MFRFLRPAAALRSSLGLFLAQIPALALGLILALILAAGHPAQARKEKIPQREQDSTAAWLRHGCPEAPGLGRAVDCGVLEVAEDRADPDSRKIYLHVRILRAETDRGLDPVVFLSGGPGQSMEFADGDGLEFWEYYIDWVMGWAGDRDVVLFAQRGITVDGVGMTCPEYGDPKVYLGATERPGPPTDWLENAAQANRTCLDRLARQGYDLAAYSTTESARDVAALRRALGIERWILYGVSYGTRLGLEVMRQDPRGVTASVFDSVFPPSVNRHWSDPQPFVDALDAFFAACAADADCARTYPRLEAEFDASIARLRADPVAVYADDPEGRSPRLHFELDDVTLIDIAFYSLYWIDGIQTLPYGLDALARGDMDLFREILLEPYVYDSLFSDWSYGMQAAVNCNDDFVWYDETVLRAAIDKHPRLASWLGTALMLPACNGWPSRPRSSGFAEPVVSAIPTLMLVGAHDPVTPPAYARQALETLENGQLHIVPGASHSVMDAAFCARTLTRAFVEKPFDELPTLCSLRDPGFDFRLR